MHETVLKAIEGIVMETLNDEHGNHVI
jgi:hypothetical protein